MVEVLEAGRARVSRKLTSPKIDSTNFLSQILELLSNNSHILTFSQLGARNDLRLNSSIRGILPIGPDGVPAFDTLEPSPLSNSEIITSYNYTLDHQGIAADVSCSYEPLCNVAVTALVPNSSVALQYQANCTKLGGTEVSADATPFRSTNSNSTLVYWPCQSAPNGTPVPSYSIYMCGRNFYETPIGNITCTVSPQAAIFPVKFQSTSGIFSACEARTLSPIAVSTIISDSLVALGTVIADSQNFQANLIAESVITLAVKSFNLPPYASPVYLRLFERMIQGILKYEVCPVDDFHFIYLLIVVP